MKFFIPFIALTLLNSMVYADTSISSTDQIENVSASDLASPPPLREAIQNTTPSKMKSMHKRSNLSSQDSYGDEQNMQDISQTVKIPTH